MPSNALVESTINGLSPEIYWKMNQTSGTTIPQNGTATTGAISLSGTYTLANDELIIGDAARFITFGTDGKGTASKGNFTVPTTTTSVSFLMKMKADFNDYTLAPYIYTLGAFGDASSNSNVQTSLRFTAPNERYISTLSESGTGIDSVNTYGVIYPGNFYSSNTVYHIAITRGPDEISGIVKEKIYVNGVLRFTGIVDYPTDGSGVTTFYINTIWDDRPGFNISLGHFAIWDRVLLRSEIYSIAEAAGYNTYQYLPPGDDTSDTYWGTYESIQANLKQTVSKTLLIPLDPLVDRNIINPEEAYENVEF